MKIQSQSLLINGLDYSHEFDQSPMKNKIIEPLQILKVLTENKKMGKKVGLCHGVFDLVHPGHIQHFKAAKALVDVLVVSITADAYVNKGPGRPLFAQDIRTESLAALEFIDFVVVSENPTAIEVIQLFKPDIYFKGSDYADEKADVTGKIALERQAVEDNDGKIVFTNELTSSSSALINKFFSKLPEDAQSWIDKFKEKYGADHILEWLDEISEVRILILGETIVDRYTYCEPLGKSSKDPILAFQKLDSNSYMGGVLAIANNCSGWVKNVSLLSAVGVGDSLIPNLIKSIPSNVNLDLVELADRPTILKHRFVDKTSSGRIFEYYEFENTELSEFDSKVILQKIKTKFSSVDLVIVADYGHSFFTKEIIANLENNAPFLCVNTQANAGNRGYNTISKYKKADFISLNGGELQLELRDRDPDYSVIVPKIIDRMHAKLAVLTLGAAGLMVFGNSGENAHIPAFASRVIDKVGAGDAVLAISSLLAKIGAPLEVIGFFANLVAAHEVSQLGHQVSLSISDLKKHSKAILG